MNLLSGKLINAKFGRLLANALAGIAPGTSAKLSHACWTKTWRFQRPARELNCLRQATQNLLRVEGQDIVLYSWGEGPKVLLIHGWNGRATQYFAYVDALLEKGFGVLAFDAPGHGESSGDQTNVMQVSRLVNTIHQRYGRFEAMIGHSFGFLVAVNALRLGVKTNAMIGISSPADFGLLLAFFCKGFALNSKAETALTEFLKTRYGLKHFDEISAHVLAREFKFPCLIIHDERDNQVPVSEARKIAKAWPASELLITKGLGHMRILRDPSIIRQSIAFLGKSKLC
ncbi:MAG TPA: alpha/beta hydrolase [Gammaproteobacteria bacterium]|nr:alpha/beta hydrolase [Gammaproteobacteria bacterium]